MKDIRQEKRNRRARRTRARIRRNVAVPRLSIFRSNQYTYVQLIDDQKGITIASASTHSSKKKTADQKKAVSARELGAQIAKLAKEREIKRAVFDRGAYRYHGRVREVAEGARSEGLEL